MLVIFRIPTVVTNSTIRWNSHFSSAIRTLRLEILHKICPFILIHVLIIELLPQLKLYPIASHLYWSKTAPLSIRNHWLCFSSIFVNLHFPWSTNQPSFRIWKGYFNVMVSILYSFYSIFRENSNKFLKYFIFRQDGLYLYYWVFGTVWCCNVALLESLFI